MKNRELLHQKLRHSIVGSAQRPRMAVYRSLTNIFVQLIDDQSGKTLVQENSLKVKGTLSEKADKVGAGIAAKAKELKIGSVVFDRGGFQYHGAIEKVADSARQEGLKI